MNYHQIVNQQIELWRKIVIDCLKLGKCKESQEAESALNYWKSQLERLEGE